MFSKRKIAFKILEYLRSRTKASVKELYEILSNEFDISYSQLSTLLMQLEIEGFLTVSEGKEYIVILKK